MSDELKPCPLCGEPALLNSEDGWIECSVCDMGFVWDDDELTLRMAIDSWNTRPIEDALRKEFNDLQKSISFQNEQTAITMRMASKEMDALRKELEEAKAACREAMSLMVVWGRPAKLELALQWDDIYALLGDVAEGSESK